MKQLLLWFLAMILSTTANAQLSLGTTKSTETPMSHKALQELTYVATINGKLVGLAYACHLKPEKTALIDTYVREQILAPLAVMSKENAKFVAEAFLKAAKESSKEEPKKYNMTCNTLSTELDKIISYINLNYKGATK